MRVIWTDPALDRVAEIAVYIAQDDPRAAERWALELFAAVERLTDFPDSGRVVPEVGKRAVRELIFGSYRVFYRVSDAVDVLSVRHGSQLLRASDVGED